jgi:hypothetical protein
MAAATPSSTRIFEPRASASRRMDGWSVASRAAAISRADARRRSTGLGPTPSPCTRRPQNGWSPKKGQTMVGSPLRSEAPVVSRSTMVHGGAHVREQRAVGGASQDMNGLRRVADGERAGAGGHHRSLSRKSQGLDELVGQRSGVEAGHAAKSDVDRAIAGREKCLQSVRRRPMGVLDHPVAGDMDVRRKSSGLGTTCLL